MPVYKKTRIDNFIIIHRLVLTYKYGKGIEENLKHQITLHLEDRYQLQKYFTEIAGNVI